MRRSLVLLILGLCTANAHAQQRRHVIARGDSNAYAPDVMAAARRDYLPIRACYDATPRSVLERIRSLSLVVADDGSITDVEIDPGSGPVRRFRACLAPVLRTWHFPAPPSHAAVRITYGFAELRSGVESASATR